MTDNTTPAAGDNIETALKELRNNLRAMGRDEADGSASRPKAAVAMTAAAYDGTIDEDDTADLYTTYAAGIAQRAKDNPMTSGASTDPEHKSAKQQISKFRQFIKLGMLPEPVDGREILDRAIQISKAMEGAEVKTYSRFDGMLNVAREQLKQPDTPLTDEQIEQAVCRPESEEKTDLDKLIDAYKKAHKLAEKIPMPATEAARDAYADAVTEAGGELPAMTKEEKKEAEAMAFLRSRGMVAVNALPAE